MKMIYKKEKVILYDIEIDLLFIMDYVKMNMDGKSCAIFVDGDNFMYNGMIELFDHIRRWNMKVLMKRVYGNFADMGMSNWRDICLDYNMTSIHLWTKHSKNSVDMKMTCDIQETLYGENPQIDVYILCTGDRDFIPVIEKIHMKRKMVIGISTNYFGTSMNLRNECDQFYYVNRRNYEVDSYKSSKEMDQVPTSPKKKSEEKKSKSTQPMRSRHSDQFSLSSDDFSMESFFEISQKEDHSLKKSPPLNPIQLDEIKSKIDMMMKKIQKPSSRLHEPIIHDTRDAHSFDPNGMSQGGHIESVPKKSLHTSMPTPTKEEIKGFVVDLLKKVGSRGVFISQVKDEILRVYPNFHEKDYPNTNTFSKFMRSLEPEVKTRFDKVGVLHAYV